MKKPQVLKWKVLEPIFQIKTPWVVFHAEKCLDNENNEIDYYTVERADSIIILPFFGDRLIKPSSFYRHGAKKVTLDFPGGRFENGNDKRECVFKILQRELNIKPENVDMMIELNQEGWLVDSSFSDQKLYGIVVKLNVNTKLPLLCSTVPNNLNEVIQIINELECLQCRSVLMQWYIQEKVYKYE